MTDGAHTPLTRARPDQSANLTDHTAGPDPAPDKPCQLPLTRRHTKPLEQAGSRHDEWMRLGLEPEQPNRCEGEWGEPASQGLEPGSGVIWSPECLGC